MYLHLLYLALGLADWSARLVGVGRSDTPGRGRVPETPSWRRSGGASLVLGTGALALGWALSWVAPPVAHGLGGVGTRWLSSATALLAGGLCAAVLASLGRFLHRCHHNGREIHAGRRIPGWRRGER